VIGLPESGSRRHRGAAVCLALTTAALLVAPAVSAAQAPANVPAKSIVLTAGKSPFRDLYVPVLGSSTSLVYTQSPYPYASQTLRLRRRNAAESTLKFNYRNEELPTSLAGSSLTGADDFSSKLGVVQNNVEWWNLAKATSGVLDLPKTETYLSSVPGGVLAISKTGVLEGYPASGATATSLGTPFPGAKSGSVPIAAAGSNGVVLVADTGSVTYLAWSHPKHFTSLNVGGSQYTDLFCSSVIAGSTGCSATNAAKRPVIIRASLTGGAPVITTLPKSACPADVFVTSSVTAWTDGCALTINSVPAATSSPVSTSKALAGDGGGLVAAYGKLAVAELNGLKYTIDTLTTATSPPVSVVASVRSPVVAGHIAITAGRVAYYDDQHAAIDTWTRTVGGSVKAASVGSARSLGHPGSGSFIDTGGSPRLSLSGEITAAAGTGKGLTIRSPIRNVTIAAKQAVSNVDASGDRVTFAVASSGHPRLYDLRTGKLTTLSTAIDASIWGNYLVYAKANGSVWRQELGGHRQPVRLRGPLTGTRIGAPNVVLFTWGDEVGWEIQAPAASGPGWTMIGAVRNAKTLAPAQVIPSQYLPMSASANGVLEKRYVGNEARYFIQPYGSASRAEVLLIAQTGLLSGEPDEIAVSDDRVAWIDGHNVARLAALPVAAGADRPRDLGDPVIGAASNNLAKTPWRAFIPLSAGLTSCAVTIRSGAKLVQTLSCSAAAAKQGDAVVGWNGRDVAGHSVKAGTYTWRLTAANRYGTALAADGTHTAITGRLTVT
jgi:hypothetical protein